jgi:hypothetical protein
MNLTSLYVLSIVFIATLIRSAFGFGEALVAVPLLAFCIPLGVAAPLAVLVSITVAAIVVVQDWKKIHIQSAGWLLLSILFGIPLCIAVTVRHRPGATPATAMAAGMVEPDIRAHAVEGQPLEATRLFQRKRNTIAVFRSRWDETPACSRWCYRYSFRS